MRGDTERHSLQKPSHVIQTCPDQEVRLLLNTKAPVSHCLHDPLTYHNKSPQYCPIHDRLWFRDDHQTSLFMDQPVTGGASLKGACQPGV